MPNEQTPSSKSEDQPSKSPWSKPRIRMMSVTFTRTGTKTPAIDELSHDADDGEDNYQHYS